MQYKFQVIKEKIGMFHLEGNLIGESDGMALTDIFNEQMEDGILDFVIDLTNLQHINSSGLGVLITLLTKTRKKNGELYLVNPSDYIRNLMLITKLNSIFSIYSTTDEAVAALEAK